MRAPFFKLIGRDVKQLVHQSIAHIFFNIPHNDRLALLAHPLKDEHPDAENSGDKAFFQQIPIT